MPIKRRIRVSDKRKAVELLRSKSLEEVARIYNVTTMTIRNWDSQYGGAQVAPAPKLVPFLQQRVETVPLPPAPDPAAAPGPETPAAEEADGGYAAARVAAGLDPEPEPAPENAPPPEEPKKPEAPKIDPAEGLIFMSKIGVQLSVRFYAAKLKVKLTDQVKDLAKLTDDEEQQLQTYAPFAAPYISELLTKYGPVIGAGIYGFIYFTMLTDRFAALKELAPKKEIEGQAVPVKP